MLSEKSINELAEQFTLLMIEGDMLLEMYKEGKVGFQKLLKHTTELSEARAKVQEAMSVQVTRFYGKAKQIRQNKNIQELGFEAEDA